MTAPSAPPATPGTATGVPPRLRRVRASGQQHSDPAHPVRALATRLADQADGTVRFKAWKAAEGGGLRTTASWVDPAAGLVIAALVLCEAPADAAEPHDPPHRPAAAGPLHELAHGDGRVHWVLTAHASLGWSPAAVSPVVALGLDGNPSTAHDPSGIPLFDGTILMTDTAAISVSQHHAALVPGASAVFMSGGHNHQILLRALTDPERATAVLVVANSHKNKKLDSRELLRATWPGICTVFMTGPRFGKLLARQLPERPLPVDGARLYLPHTGPSDSRAAPSAHQDVVLTRSQLRRSGWAEPLVAAAAQACARRGPDALSVEAARLLDEHPRLKTAAATPTAEPARRELAPARHYDRADQTAPLSPASAAPPVSPHPHTTPPAAADQASAQLAETQLAETQRRLARLRTSHQRLQGDHQHALTHASRLREQLQTAQAQLQLLSAITAERDSYLAEYQRAEQERDQAVRERGILAQRLTALARSHGDNTTTTTDTDAALIDDLVPGSIRELLAHAAAQYHLLDLTHLDPQPAQQLDKHPKAQGWRRKIADALASLHHYATAKRAFIDTGRPPGPELASFLTFLKSGRPGALISARTTTMSESASCSTSPRFRKARTFPVDPATHPSGRAFMGAHIKFDTTPPAPRLHFLDDLTGRGVIYLGHLGAHRINDRTN